MTSNATDCRRANLIGCAWMIAAMAAFSVEDSLIKAASMTLPVGQILIIFGLGGTSLFTLATIARKEPLFVPDVLSALMLTRLCFEIVGRLFFVLAVALTPLSSATVILQATPLVVVAGATLFFGEKVSWLRWAAICVGLTGVLIIVQPGKEGFSILSMLAVVGMFGFAARDLASRAAPATLSTSILGLYGFLAIVVAGVMFAVWQGVPFVRPSAITSIFLCGAIVTGVAAYACLMKAMRIGEVSAVTPFRYTRLIFGVGLGIFFFEEQLSITMLVGSSLIFLSGLFVLWRHK